MIRVEGRFNPIAERMIGDYSRFLGLPIPYSLGELEGNLHALSHMINPSGIEPELPTNHNELMKEKGLYHRVRAIRQIGVILAAMNYHRNEDLVSRTWVSDEKMIEKKPWLGDIQWWLYSTERNPEIVEKRKRKQISREEKNFLRDLVKYQVYYRELLKICMDFSRSRLEQEIKMVEKNERHLERAFPWEMMGEEGEEEERGLVDRVFEIVKEENVTRKESIPLRGKISVTITYDYGPDLV